MNARNQLLVVLTALMMVCSSGAMVAGAAPASVDEHNQVDEDGAVLEEDAETAPAEEPVEEESGEEVTNETPVEDGVNETDGDVGSQNASVAFSDQATVGETVVVDEVTMASGGFVVIHDSSLLAGNVFESVIGTSAYLEAGTHENVEVTLEEPLEEDETLVAMPHRDTNNNQAYDFVQSEGAADIPYLTAADDPVTDDAVVTVDQSAEEPEQPVEEQPEQPVDNETEQPVEEEPEQPVDNETEQPVEEEPEQPVDNETEQPVEEEPEQPVEEEPEQPVDNETEQPVEEEPQQPVEEEPQQPVEEEPQQPVEEEPQQPVEEEPQQPEQPVEEQPDEVEGDEINVVIENLTVFVFVSDSGHAQANASDHGMQGMQADGVTVEDGNETDTGAQSDYQTETTLQVGDQQVNIAVEQITIVPANQHHAGMEDAGEAPANERSQMTGSGDATIVIEDATVFVFIDGLEMFPQQPVEEQPEQPVEEEPEQPVDNETEQPVEEQPEQPVEEQPEQPVEEEPEQPIDNETEEPIGEQPEQPVDNETEQPVEEEPEQPVDNETEQPVEEEPEQPVDNETEQPVEEEPEQPVDNETEQPVEEEPEQPIDNETEEPIGEEPEQPVDNETEQPVEEQPEQPVDNETEQPVEEEPADAFEVENLEAPASVAAGESITVTATVANPTDEQRTEFVQFRLDGDLVQAEEVTLEAGQTTNVQFEVDTTDLEPGQYVHMVLSETSGEVATLEVTDAADDGLEGDLENGTETDGNVTDGNGTDAATA